MIHLVNYLVCSQNQNMRKNRINFKNNSTLFNTSQKAKLDEEFLITKKRRIVKFIQCWMVIAREHFFQDPIIQLFIKVIFTMKVYNYRIIELITYI